MTQKRKTLGPKLIINVLMLFSLLVSGVSVAVPPIAQAQSSRPLCANGQFANDDEGCQSQYGVPAVDNETQARCEGKPTVEERRSCIEGRNVVKNDCNGPNIRAGAPPDDENHCAILDYLVTFINGLSALVGVVVILMVILGGIQYAASKDEPQKVKAARSRITNALIALAIYIFMYAFLQWVIPGGAF